MSIPRAGKRKEPALTMQPTAQHRIPLWSPAPAHAPSRLCVFSSLETLALIASGDGSVGVGCYLRSGGNLGSALLPRPSPQPPFPFVLHPCLPALGPQHLGLPGLWDSDTVCSSLLSVSETPTTILPPTFCVLKGRSHSVARYDFLSHSLSP